MSSWVSKIVAATFISALALIGSAKAANVGLIYEWCKPFADRAFKLENTKDLACQVYFQGIADTAGQLCFLAKDRDYKDKVKALGGEAALIGVEHLLQFSSDDFSKNKNAVIQMFVNDAKDHPENWDTAASTIVLMLARSVNPCEIKP